MCRSHGGQKGFGDRGNGGTEGSELPHGCEGPLQRQEALLKALRHLSSLHVNFCDGGVAFNVMNAIISEDECK